MTSRVLEFGRWLARDYWRLRKFKDRHDGRSAFVIGNGPSLAKMDLTQLAGRYTFGLNKLFLHPDFDQIAPTYHVAVNPLVIRQSEEEFSRIERPLFLSTRGAKGVGSSLGSNVYTLFTGGPLCFREDVRRPVSEGHTVTFVAMQLAFFMGFTRIYLIGVDHRFNVEGQPNERQLLKGDDPNHFSKGYFSNQEWQLPDLEMSELAYRLAKVHFERDGRSVVDATLDGALDMFPKLSFAAALEDKASLESSYLRPD